MKTVQAIYRKRFNFNDFPHKFQITHWIKKFNKDIGTLIKSTKKGQLSTNGRKLTARSSEIVDAVRDSFPRILKKSIRRCSQELGLSCSLFHKISKNNFQLYPYRIQIKQTHTKWNGKTCWDVLVVRKQDWRNVSFSSEGVVQWWSCCNHL